MSGLWLFVALVIAIAVMIVSISRFKVPPFIAIIGISLILAFVAGIPLRAIPTTIERGFGSIFSSIGLLVIFGSIIGIIMDKTGAAMKLAECTVKFCGKKHPEIALELMGWIISIPIFRDSGFIILDPVRRALHYKTGRSSVTLTVALASGLFISNVFIPPTPGPLIAGGMLGIVRHDMLQMIVFGCIISVPCLIAAWAYANCIGKRVHTIEDSDRRIAMDSYDQLMDSFSHLPNGWLSIAPIITPIIALTLGSLSTSLEWGGVWGNICVLIGSPTIAMVIGLIFAIILLGCTHHLSDFATMTVKALTFSGPILFVAGAGSVLGTIIVDSGFVDLLLSYSYMFVKIGLFLPFILAAVLKTAQGSTLVAIITSASIMGSISDPYSLMASFGMDTPSHAALAAMAIGAGAMTVSHANDSYFWVVTDFGNLAPQDGYKTLTVATLIMGCVAMLSIWLISLFIR